MASLVEECSAAIAGPTGAGDDSGQLTPLPTVGLTRCLLVWLVGLVATWQVETIRSNVIGCLNLADVTNELGLHMTYYGTGCIFHYDDEFPEGSGKGFKESDKPNFTGSYYSYTKASKGAGGCRTSRDRMRHTPIWAR